MQNDWNIIYSIFIATSTSHPSPRILHRHQGNLRHHEKDTPWGCLWRNTKWRTLSSSKHLRIQSWVYNVLISEMLITIRRPHRRIDAHSVKGIVVVGVSRSYSIQGHHRAFVIATGGSIAVTKKGTKFHFKSPTVERRHVLCVEVGGIEPTPARSGRAGYASLNLSATPWRRACDIILVKGWHPHAKAVLMRKKVEENQEMDWRANTFTI